MRRDIHYGWSVVYTLEGPDGAVRYVGMSSNATERLSAHRFSHTVKTPLGRWLRGLREASEVVTVRIVSRHRESHAARVAERGLIRRAFAAGFDLFNAKPARSRAPWVVVDETSDKPRRSIHA